MDESPENRGLRGPSDGLAFGRTVILSDLMFTAMQMRAGSAITLNEDLIAAYQAASSPHTLRALQSDLAAFDLCCRAFKADRAASLAGDRSRLSRRAGDPAGERRRTGAGAAAAVQRSSARYRARFSTRAQYPSIAGSLWR